MGKRTPRLACNAVCRACKVAPSDYLTKIAAAELAGGETAPSELVADRLQTRILPVVVDGLDAPNSLSIFPRALAATILLKPIAQKVFVFALRRATGQMTKKPKLALLTIALSYHRALISNTAYIHLP